MPLPVRTMFSVLSSPLNHTQTNQNKVMPITYRREYENKIKQMEKIEKMNIGENSKSNIYSGIHSKHIGIKYVHRQPYETTNRFIINSISDSNSSNSSNSGSGNENTSGRGGFTTSKNINRNLGWGSNRFFSLSTMRNGGGCGCG